MKSNKVYVEVSEKYLKEGNTNVEVQIHFPLDGIDHVSYIDLVSPQDVADLRDALSEYLDRRGNFRPLTTEDLDKADNEMSSAAEPQSEFGAKQA